MNHESKNEDTTKEFSDEETEKLFQELDSYKFYS